jgi:hypothetical protein
MSSVEFYFTTLKFVTAKFEENLFLKLYSTLTPPQNSKTEFNTLDNMPNLEQFVDFNPENEIPSLDGKVVFITGGWSQPQCSE